MRVFETRIKKKENSSVRDLVVWLRSIAENQKLRGSRAYAHSTPGGSWGITYKLDDRVVCRFDPKPTLGYVRAYFLGAREADLQRIGTVRVGKNRARWVDVKDKRRANALIPLISKAFERAYVFSELKRLVEREREIDDEIRRRAGRPRRATGRRPTPRV